ncbi:transaldolase family protein, partial [Muricomes intestini]
FNRMNNMNVDSKKALEEITWLFEHYHKDTKILAASFKNTHQIMDALLAGAHAVTASPELYTQMVESPVIDSAIAGFGADWEAVYGDKRIYEI